MFCNKYFFIDSEPESNMLIAVFSYGLKLPEDILLFIFCQLFLFQTQTLKIKQASYIENHICAQCSTRRTFSKMK